MVDLPPDPKPGSLFSWPPNQNLVAVQLLIRGILLLNDIVGLALGFATGFSADFISGIIAGSFFSLSLVLIPIFIFWNARQLLPKNKNKLSLFRGRRGYEQVQGEDDTEQHDHGKKTTTGLKRLKFTMSMDLIGALAFFGLYIGMIDETNRYWEWRYQSGSFVMAASYASVAVLVAWILHAALCVSEVLQIRSANRALRPVVIQCPVCNHTMRELPQPAAVASGALVLTAAQHAQQQQDYLVDDTPNAQDGSEGDTTTTTATTTRHISPQAGPSARAGADASRGRGDSYSDANEAEGEGDGLLAKTG